MSLVSCPRVLVGGTLIDGTGADPIKDSVVVLRDEYIVAAGKRGEVEIPPGSEVYDVTGMTVTPGLIDSHCHFAWMGVSMLTSVAIRYTATMKDALELIRKRAEKAKPGEWIIGRGYDEAKWPENRYITAEDIDAVVPDKPVALVRICGHLVSINNKAMKLAGITSETPDPDGGTIDKDEKGEPVGILRDCRDLVWRVIPPTSTETMVEGLKVASDHALSLGCTGIHDAGLGPQEITAYQTAHDNGYLKVRANVMLRTETPEAAMKLGIKTGFGDRFLRVGPVKLLIDGSLGAHTAALFEPYEDDPSTTGLLLEDPAVITEKASAAHGHGFQVAIHAIGDLAIEHVIDSIQETLRREPRKNHRHRIEHCEILSAQQIERIRELGIIPAMQPNFIGEWSGPGSMYRQRLGERRDRASNPYRVLLDEGITVAFGSDGMPFNPIYGIWSAVNHPIRESRISLVEAVKCYTLNSAYAGFHENHVGSVEAGKLADIAVFDRDLTEIAPETIRDAKCYMTLVNGKILYHRDQ
ncbi:MAG: amidohydrolase [Candidatus Bathyarchaeota archaeon]